MKIQLDIPDILNKKLKKEKIERDLDNLQQTIIQILSNYLGNGNKDVSVIGTILFDINSEEAHLNLFNKNIYPTMLLDMCVDLKNDLELLENQQYKRLNKKEVKK